MTEYQPLYAQVKASLLKRISSGAWKPGEMLPSEFELASEYGVSQGTVRKALLALEAARLIVRRQGRGTFVARHSQEDSLLYFFRIVGLDDQRLIPSSVVLRHEKQRATPEQAKLLSIKSGAMVHGIVRTRLFDGTPAIFERIFIPVALMPNLRVEKEMEMRDEMYVIYQELFGITIARASERLHAVVATDEEARYLEISPESPLLEIIRVARDVNGRPVELRISRCNTDRGRYATEIS